MEQLVSVNEITICAESFGDPGDPTILLIGGMSASMDWWETEFCQRLADAGRFVIRYDQRDTGRSTSYPAGQPGYSGADLISDAVGLLDALGRSTAHVVGISMGGGLAQVLTLEHPDRVDSLTVISSSHGPGDDDLPGSAAQLTAYYSDPPSPPDWNDADAVVEYLVNDQRVLAAADPAFDDAPVRAVATRAVARTNDLEASMTNHGLLEGDGPWRSRLGEITVPTLVLHGDQDPLFPPAHGISMAAEITGARLLVIAGVGHELPQRVWDQAIAAITQLTTPRWQQRADRLAATAIADEEPTAWFEQLYAGALAGRSDVPWDRTAANPLLVDWLPGSDRSGWRRAIVVGCGLGADAEFLAAQGLQVDAFDISESAITIARSRHPESTVRYRSADARELPDEWRRAFDLVVEIYTIQALPDPPRSAVIASVAELVAPGGSLLVVAAARADDEPPSDGPPFALLRNEVAAFADHGLALAGLQRIETTDPWPRWQAEFTRPTG